MVGGLLVALAALLTWWTAVGDGGDPLARYVVAARPIGPGERITDAHLALAPADLPASLRRSAFTSSSSLVDAVATGPIGEGELVQAGSVGDPQDRGPERELTFPVATTWAAGGTLVVGDRIDVYATYGEGTNSQTRRVLTDVRVRRIGTVNSERIGTTGRQEITVGLDRSVPVALVVNAAQSAEITVARVSGEPADASEGDGHDRFDASDLDEGPAAGSRPAPGVDADPTSGATTGTTP